MVLINMRKNFIFNKFIFNSFIFKNFVFKNFIFNIIFILIFFVFITFFTFFSLSFFNVSTIIYAQQNQSYLDFFDSINLYSNPAFYSFDDMLYSFSFSSHFSQFNQININLLNGIILSYLFYPDFESNRFLIGFPFYFKVKDYPLSFGVSITNIFINVGYYVRIFDFLESGLSIFYLYDENIEPDKKFNYEILLGLRFFEFIKIRTEFYLDNSIFYQNLNPSYFFENYFNYRLVLIFDFDQASFGFSYFSNKIIQFDFAFYRKFSAFTLSFSIDQSNNSYSFGLGFSQSKRYRQSNASSVLYIIDFNVVKPDASLFLQLREKAKQKGNIYLFIGGKNLSKAPEIEDLIPLIKKLRKNNLCYIYLKDVDLNELALASSFDFIILSKVSNIDLSYKKLKEKIITELLADIYQYLKFYDLKIYNNYDCEIEKLIEILKSDISKDENLGKFVFQQVQYLIEIISQNRKIDKQIILNFVFNNNDNNNQTLSHDNDNNSNKTLAKDNNNNETLTNDKLLDLGFVDYLCEYKDIITKIKEIAKKNEYEIKSIENIFSDYNKIYKDKNKISKKIAIVYLKGLVISEKDKNSSSFSSTLSYDKVEKIVKKIEDENYTAVLFINDSSFGDIEEGERILSLIQNLSKKVKLYILQNSIISTGAFISSLVKDNLFAHENSLIIPLLPISYSVNLSIENFLNEKILNDRYLEKINSIIENQRNLLKKDIKQINEISFLSGYEAAGLNLIDYLSDFNSLIDLIIKQLNLNEKNINFEIFYTDNFEKKITFIEFINNLFNQFLENFIK